MEKWRSFHAMSSQSFMVDFFSGCDHKQSKKLWAMISKSQQVEDK